MLLIAFLLVLALVLTLLAGFNVSHPRLQLGWLGVSALILALLIKFWPG